MAKFAGISESNIVIPPNRARAEFGDVVRGAFQAMRQSLLDEGIAEAIKLEKTNRAAVGGKVEVYPAPKVRGWEQTTIKEFDRFGSFMDWLYVPWEPALKRAKFLIEDEMKKYTATGAMASQLVTVGSRVGIDAEDFEQITPHGVRADMRWIGLINRMGYARRFEPDWGKPFKFIEVENSIFDAALRKFRKDYPKSVMMSHVSFVSENTTWKAGDPYTDPHDRVPIFVIRAAADNLRRA